MSQATICDHCREVIKGVTSNMETATPDNPPHSDLHDYCGVLRAIADLPAESQLKVRNARGKWTKLENKLTGVEAGTTSSGNPRADSEE